MKLFSMQSFETAKDVITFLQQYDSEILPRNCIDRRYLFLPKLSDKMCKAKNDYHL